MLKFSHWVRIGGEREGEWALDYEEIGRRVRRLRKARGISQEQLAERIERSTAFVGHIERGSRRMSVDTLIRLVDALECTADELLGRSPGAMDAGDAARALLELALRLTEKEQWNAFRSEHGK